MTPSSNRIGLVVVLGVVPFLPLAQLYCHIYSQMLDDSVRNHGLLLGPSSCGPKVPPPLGQTHLPLCDPDPPLSLVSFSYYALEVETSSIATVTFNGATVPTSITNGDARIDLSACQAFPCTVTFSRVLLELGAFDVEGSHISGVVVRNDGLVSATLDAAGRLFVSPLDTHFVMTGALDGTLFEYPLSGGFPLVGGLDPVSKRFTLTGSLVATTGDSVAFSLQGQIVSQPPVAAIAGAQDFECVRGKGRGRLDSSASWDPDNDLVSRTWYLVARDGTRERIGTLPVLDRELPLGAHTIELEVRDARMQINRAQLAVHVVDTRPPILTAAFAHLECLWPPNGRWQEVELGKEILITATDDCDTALPPAQIVEVRPSQIGGHAVASAHAGGQTACVLAEREGYSAGRRYEFDVVSGDSSGNLARTTLWLDVPHDQRQHPSCTRAQSRGGCP